MRIAGFFLLVAGWVIVITALFLLRSQTAMAAFVVAGIAVQVLGLIFAIHWHRVAESERA